MKVVSGRFDLRVRSSVAEDVRPVLLASRRASKPCTSSQHRVVHAPKLESQSQSLYIAATVAGVLVSADVVIVSPLDTRGPISS